MKEQVIQFLRTDRTWSGAVRLYQKIGDKLSLKRRLNSEVENPSLKDVLFEELREMGGISRDHFSAILNTPVHKDATAQATPSAPSTPLVKSKGKGKGKKTDKPKGKSTGKPKGKAAEKKTSRAAEKEQPAKK